MAKQKYAKYDKSIQIIIIKAAYGNFPGLLGKPFFINPIISV